MVKMSKVVLSPPFSNKLINSHLPLFIFPVIIKVIRLSYFIFPYMFHVSTVAKSLSISRNQWQEAAEHPDRLTQVLGNQDQEEDMWSALPLLQSCSCYCPLRFFPFLFSKAKTLIRKTGRNGGTPCVRADSVTGLCQNRNACIKAICDLFFYLVCPVVYIDVTWLLSI